MGGGPELKDLHEKILVALPGEAPTALLERLKHKFPNVEVEFFQIGYKLSPDVPKGMFLSSFPLANGILWSLLGEIGLRLAEHVPLACGTNSWRATPLKIRLAAGERINFHRAWY